MALLVSRRSLLALLLLSCSGGCSLWRRRHELDLLGCQGCGQAEDADEQSDRDSTASCYPPPQYSRCNSFSQPPPYSEVSHARFETFRGYSRLYTSARANIPIRSACR